MMGPRIVFAGGGTGGHVYPAISIADELRRRFTGFSALFVGTSSGLEARVVPGAGYDIRFIFSRGVRGRGPVGKALTMLGLSVGVAQAIHILSRFKPDLVFGAGGYASAAVVIAASLLRKRIVLQEQNSIPGLTNRKLASRAERIYLGFEKALEYLGGRNHVMVTGNPLRRQILSEPEEDPRGAFGLAPDRPVLLVFGGSQGARRLNRAAVEYFLAEPGMQGIIQTGSADHGWVGERLRAAAGRVYAAPYIERIDLAYRAADAALARAGALSVSELAAVGLPAILVPYPFAADNHQHYNAEALVETGGAVMIADGDLSPSTLAEALGGMLGDPERLAAMKRALLESAPRDPAGAIADDIESLVGKMSGGAS
jgi:UDP-N-acetylglucosamine--N-acetylmuramyl-(pentapeptide) pyrophosphoryl-undecaprenol N-acetylglucosamine transferase